ncbi:putative C6 zinc finger domain [Seiridium cardinale]
MKSFYLRLSRNESVPSGQVALLLSIFSLSAFFYNAGPASEVATSELDATRLSKFWGNGALDVLDHSQRNSSGCMEDIQACILMSYVTYHIDGPSARGRLLATTATSIARDLRLHRLDANGEDPMNIETNPRVLIEQEVKRRVFWHIAATDWLHATISGPQEGMYFIHPSHVKVKLPRDCNDEEIAFGGMNDAMGEPQPTSMAFYLARVKLAHLCREMADTMPLETAKLMQIPYEHIINLDNRYVEFLSSLPFFLRFDVDSRGKSKTLETIYPNIPIMRYCITTAAHSRRFRLHQKFLLRITSDRRYGYSRRACLESARVVLQAYADSGKATDSPSAATSTARMAMALHYTHLALTVMVMDLCFNQNEADADERKAEVGDVMRALELERHISPLLDQSLNSLNDILQKHSVQLLDPVASGTDRSLDSGRVNASDETSPLHPAPLEEGINEDWLNMYPSFNEVWQTANQTEMGFDSVTWDDIFSTFDSRPF